jgi:hypothetical protein
MGLLGDILSAPFEIASDVTETIAEVLEDL